MANVDRPNGFVPVQHQAGGTPQRSGDYEIASGLTQSLFKGDPVVKTGTGRQITIATAGNDNQIVGIFDGVQYTDANGDVIWLPYWLTGTTTQGGVAATAFVFDDPDQLFVAQVSEAAGLIEANVGNQANFVAGTGSQFTGRSAAQLDQTSLSAAAGRQFRIEGLAGQLDNSYGQFAKAVCSIRTHQRLSAVGF